MSNLYTTRSVNIRTVAGFTLLELVVAIAVISILASVATPFFRQMVANNESQSLAEEFVAALNMARVEAVTRGRRVTLCPDDGASDCGTDWSQGTLLVVDSAISDDQNTVSIADPAADILLKPTSIVDGAVVTVSGGISTDFIRFNREGMMAPGVTSSTPPTPMQFDVRVDGCTGRNQYGINVSLAGLIRTQRAQCPS